MNVFLVDLASIWLATELTTSLVMGRLRPIPRMWSALGMMAGTASVPP